MKNWKLLLVFGLIAVLFVFAGCIAGTTTPEETPTATATETATPTATTTPWAGAPIITKVSFLSPTDNYLNIAEAKKDQTVEGTAPEGSEIFVYIDNVQVATGKTNEAGKWEVTITSKELKALEDGKHEITAKYSLDSIAVGRATLSNASEPKEFTSDQTAPTIVSASGVAGCYEEVQEGENCTIEAGEWVITPTVLPLSPYTTSTTPYIIQTDTLNVAYSGDAPTPETGAWRVELVESAITGMRTFTFTNTATNNNISITVAPGDTVQVVLPDSNYVIQFSFNDRVGYWDLITIEADQQEAEHCTPNIVTRVVTPATIKVKFSEEVAFAKLGYNWWWTPEDAENYWVNIMFWVDREPAYFVAYYGNATESPANSHTTWTFIQNDNTRIRAAQQFSAMFREGHDKAGNPLDPNPATTQGVFVANDGCPAAE